MELVILIGRLAHYLCPIVLGELSDFGRTSWGFLGIERLNASLIVVLDVASDGGGTGLEEVGELGDGIASEGELDYLEASIPFGICVGLACLLDFVLQFAVRVVSVRFGEYHGGFLSIACDEVSPIRGRPPKDTIIPDNCKGFFRTYLRGCLLSD